MSLPSRSLDLGLHALGDPVTKDQHLGTFTQDGIPEKQTQLTLLGLVVVKELRKQQVRCDGNVSGIYRKVLRSTSPAYGLQIYTMGLNARRAFSSFSMAQKAPNAVGSAYPSAFLYSAMIGTSNLKFSLPTGGFSGI